MKSFLRLLIVMLLLGAAQSAAAQVATDPSWLKLDYQRVRIAIADQIAVTRVEMQFTNTGTGLAEGTFIFPLPKGAAVDQLTLFIDGMAIDAKILPADEARAIYDAIVRQYRDPALLEYIGQDAIQASVFPIPAGESRRVEIGYRHLLTAENGLFKVAYPLHTAGTQIRRIEQMSISVEATGIGAAGSIYSPTHNVAVSRSADGFRAGFEAGDFAPGGDFTLFYGVSGQVIDLSLLSYRESAAGDGFFMLLVQPPLTVDAEAVVAKDVIIVLDQSGSMQGEKWGQARAAARYVLEQLNPRDRFNVVLFSTGWRIYSDRLEGVEVAGDAAGWIDAQMAEGSTDINGSLLTALAMADAERPTTILFLTDGLATDGVTDTPSILENLKAAARPNVRIFAFGVGDDVDTFLIDAIVRDHRGTSTYVRPGERIDEEVASLYNKISAPVLTDVALDFGGVMVDSLYPAALPDLFAGEQLTLVGRYRGGAEGMTITLRGKVAGEPQTFTYEALDFTQRAGGEAFIARLWATRRIGDLLNRIRLDGEDPELIDSIISLSLRYGIITPYTSFLIEEDDILSADGREAARQALSEEAEALAGEASGSRAVDAADMFGGLASAESPADTLVMPPAPTMVAPGQSVDGGAPPAPMPSAGPIQTVGDKTFLYRDGVWIDTTFEPDTMTPQEVAFLSDAYFELLEAQPDLARYFALGERVIVVLEGVAYAVIPA